MLERFPPPPDRGLVGRIGLAVEAHDRIARRSRVGPVRPRFEPGLPPHVSAAPSAERRIHVRHEPVVHQAQEGWRVTFDDAARQRIERAERPLLPHVLVDPGFRHRREVRACAIAIELVAGNPRPGRDVVVVRIARRGDVVQRRKLAPQPRPRIVLIGNRVDAQPGDDALQVGRGPRGSHVPQGLRERVRATPHRDPQRPRVGRISRADDRLGARRHAAFADSGHAIAVLPGRPRAWPGRRPTEIRLRASRGSAAPCHRRR